MLKQQQRQQENKHLYLLHPGNKTAEENQEWWGPVNMQQSYKMKNKKVRHDTVEYTKGIGFHQNLKNELLRGEML